MPRILILFTLVLFLVIGVAAYVKKNGQPASTAVVSTPIEIPLTSEIPAAIAAEAVSEKPSSNFNEALYPRSAEGLPQADRMNELFLVGGRLLPIVETITYKSRVAWQKGRPAWVSDYASHYNTSRHFIARSLNGKPDYLKQDVADGSKFNVFNPEKNFDFYLLVDLSRAKMWFYYVDNDTQDRVLLKTYDVGVGRPDSGRASGFLTPLGKYSLGSRIAVYQPGMMGPHNGQKTELVRVFGTRWIPFDKELSNTTAPARGYGLHGVPWVADETGHLAPDESSVGKYESDGCIRLATKDIEELYSIIVTKPTSIEIVQDYYEAQLPGREKTY